MATRWAIRTNMGTVARRIFHLSRRACTSRFLAGHSGGHGLASARNLLATFPLLDADPAAESDRRGGAYRDGIWVEVTDRQLDHLRYRSAPSEAAAGL